MPVLAQSGTSLFALTHTWHWSIQHLAGKYSIGSAARKKEKETNGEEKRKRAVASHFRSAGHHLVNVASLVNMWFAGDARLALDVPRFRRFFAECWPEWSGGPLHGPTWRHRETIGAGREKERNNVMSNVWHWRRRSIPVPTIAAIRRDDDFFLSARPITSNWTWLRGLPMRRFTSRSNIFYLFLSRRAFFLLGPVGVFGDVCCPFTSRRLFTNGPLWSDAIYCPACDAHTSRWVRIRDSTPRGGNGGYAFTSAYRSERRDPNWFSTLKHFDDDITSANCGDR